MTLISTLAVSQAETEAALRQAKSASDAAKQLMDQQAAEGGSNTKDDKQTQIEIKELREQNKKIKAEQEATLKQAKSVSREYDRLMKEVATLQAQQEKGDKKDD